MMTKSTYRSWLAALGFILLCNGAGAIGAIFTSSAIPTWYATLTKPSWNPPSWVFGPVWTTLYCLMGISVFLIWRAHTEKIIKRRAMTYFFVQLILNALWSILFFGLQNPFFALIEILLLWAMILITLLSFYRISKTAGLLLVPYLAWVSFATFLNYTIWSLQR